MIRIKPYVVFTVIAALLVCTQPRPVGAQTLARGSDTAATAAASRTAAATPATDRLLGVALAPAATGAWAQSDSTEFDFPEDDNSHLARDITIFVIVSAFVAYFIIKVFLEDEPDEPADTGGSGGKGTP